MASTKLHRDPRRGVCQSAIVEGKDLQKTNHNVLWNLTFLASRDTARLKTIKNNKDISQKTNNRGSQMTPKRP
jgi:hypothetical protein